MVFWFLLTKDNRFEEETAENLFNWIFMVKVISQGLSCVVNHLMGDFKTKWTVEKDVSTVEGVFEVMMINFLVQRAKSRGENVT